MTHWNMEYQVLYEDCRKSLEVKTEKKIWFAECQKNCTRQIIALPSVRRRHLTKGLRRLPAVSAAALCRVPDTRQTRSLPSVIVC